MKNLVYYISGHGYGHATRSIEVIKALQKRCENSVIHVRSDAPEWLFQLNLQQRFSYHNLKIDIGAVQNTSLYIDKLRTYEKVRELLQAKDSLVAQESAFIRDVDADGIIADIPPLAFEIASAAGIPSVALTNFSWDWIYLDYVTELPAFAGLIEKIRESYRKADLLLRLPMYGDLTIFRQIQDIPLIARRAQLSKTEVLHRLRLDTHLHKPVVLVALRASDLMTIDLNALNTCSEFTFVTLDLPNAPANFMNIPKDFMTFPELVHACDFVVSKPGYGIVSETIANRTPLLYIARDDFVEYDILVKGLQQWGVSEFLPRDKFMTGQWLSALRNLQAQKEDWPELALNGADIAAAEVCALLDVKKRPADYTGR